MRRSIESIAVGLVATASLVAACLPELPEPLSCPPPAVNEATDCLEGLSMPQGQNLCYVEPNVACLRGGQPAETCACLSGECPIPDDTCYPDDECPDDVLVADDRATCLRLTGDDVGLGLADLQCLCGCPSCATICDGYGTIWGTYGTVEGQAPALVIGFGDRLPDRGCFGMYWRVRGVANFQVTLFKGPPGQEAATGAVYAVTEIGGDFIDRVLFDQSVVGNEPYCWQIPEDRPTGAVMQPYEISPDFFVTMAEIDCVIPFVTPL
ncbi:MAG: hypothetical protein RIF41_17105 [Polyangiaceae bacterium]